MATFDKSRCFWTSSRTSRKKRRRFSSNCWHCSNTCSMFSMWPEDRPRGQVLFLCSLPLSEWSTFLVLTRPICHHIAFTSVTPRRPSLPTNKLSHSSIQTGILGYTRYIHCLWSLHDHFLLSTLATVFGAFEPTSQHPFLWAKTHMNQNVNSFKYINVLHQTH